MQTNQTTLYVKLLKLRNWIMEEDISYLWCESRYGWISDISVLHNFFLAIEIDNDPPSLPDNYHSTRHAKLSKL